MSQNKACLLLWCMVSWLRENDCIRRVQKEENLYILKARGHNKITTQSTTTRIRNSEATNSGLAPSKSLGASRAMGASYLEKYSVLSRLPPHENQYAYQSGKSCKQANHELAQRAEIAIVHKEIALVTFLDIEDAFDRAYFL
ncbi:hypothetical protein Trydic_g21572 [Trypoxylus dichotomus]